ncbi:hypothetical protein CALCODRAFT_382665 [Calocera cornea HHB12733]|uniref:Uncharacterized protein n=1 Tax=Calocera cornea HHB12733 TaxID=1353952 RepID=A0A165EBW7_9BASI|nr:hypothetical protein CALCODRAFT_382665 [Calocera cornea HHB12733]
MAEFSSNLPSSEPLPAAADVTGTVDDDFATELEASQAFEAQREEEDVFLVKPTSATVVEKPAAPPTSSAAEPIYPAGGAAKEVDVSVPASAPEVVKGDAKKPAPLPTSVSEEPASTASPTGTPISRRSFPTTESGPGSPGSPGGEEKRKKRTSIFGLALHTLRSASSSRSRSRSRPPETQRPAPFHVTSRLTPVYASSPFLYQSSPIFPAPHYATLAFCDSRYPGTSSRRQPPRCLWNRAALGSNVLFFPIAPGRFPQVSGNFSLFFSLCSFWYLHCLLQGINLPISSPAINAISFSMYRNTSQHIATHRTAALCQRSPVSRCHYSPTAG